MATMVVTNAARLTGRKLQTIVTGPTTGATAKATHVNTMVLNATEERAASTCERSLATQDTAQPKRVLLPQPQRRMTTTPKAPSYMQTGYFTSERELFEGF